MPKVYLQQKINPVPDKYLVIGPDGNITTGNLPEGEFPIIHITFPEGTTNLNAHCYSFTADIEIKSSTTADCTVKQFGTWVISGFYDGNLISDSILVSEITQYYMQLRYIHNVTPAVYNLLKRVPAPKELHENDILNCDYSGNYLIVTLPKGTYKLECWGASGGYAYRDHNDYGRGGRGGYSQGIITLNEQKSMYLYCGEKGFDFSGMSQPSMGLKTSTTYSAFNGGGFAYLNSSSVPYIATGGGATDIRLSLNINERIIVAGAGGGGMYATWREWDSHAGEYVTYMIHGSGGFGGGDIGGNGSAPQYSDPQRYLTATGGTQFSGGAGSIGSAEQSNNGSFGIGGGQPTYQGTTPTNPGNYVVNATGTGGGGYYGGGAGYYSSGAGGSSYLSSLLDNSLTIAGNMTITEPDGSEATGHTGNGYIRITVLSLVGD